MTARLASHPDVAARAAEVLRQLVAAGVDVELVGHADGSYHAPDDVEDPLVALRQGALDLALVGASALRGSTADDLTTVAVLPREEYRDVLVVLRGGATGLASLPRGAGVAVCGARRRAFLKAHRRDVHVVELAPPEEGRLAETVGALDVDAIVLGAVEARLHGLVDRVAEALDPKAWLPEPGKGALALVSRHPIAEATAVDHLPTRTALRAELALLDALDVGPEIGLGTLAHTSGRWIRLWAAAASLDGERLVRSDLTGPLDEPEALGVSVAKQLADRGIALVGAPAGA